MNSCYPMVAFLAILLPIAVLGAGPDKLELQAKNLAEEVSSSDSLQLYSLDPKVYKKKDKDKDVKLFHEYRVLGSLLINQDDDLKAIRTGFSESFSDDRSIRALCFRPRHGLIAKKGDKVALELVVCFECKLAEVYDGEKLRGIISVTKVHEKLINQLLTKNKIPIAE